MARDEIGDLLLARVIKSCSGGDGVKESEYAGGHDEGGVEVVCECIDECLGWDRVVECV